MANVQHDRVDEFFDYFYQADNLARSAGEYHTEAQLLSQDEGGLWSPDAPNPITPAEPEVLRGWFRVDIAAQLDNEESAKAKLQELESEAVIKYVGELILVRSLAGTDAIERPTRGNGKYNSAPYVIRDEVQGRITDINLLRDRAGIRNLTVVSKGLVHPRTFWVNVVRPSMANDHIAPNNLQRAVEVKFLDK
jgi:hypothetical protein